MKAITILQTGGPASQPPPCLTKPLGRILVVDDDSDVRQLNAEVLIHSGYEVDAAADGAAAWEVLQTKDFSLLITDHNMLRLTGVELVKTLRAARMPLPVIMAATGLPTEELARNPSLQPVAVLAKPFYISQLLETVRVVLPAAASPREQIVSLSNRQSQPASDGLVL